MSDTLSALLDAHPADALAIGAPDRDWLTYGGLRDLTDRTLAALHAAGIGRGDRVGIVLPNGPEMAAAFFTIAQGAVTAPLNPAYREDEYDFYLSDLKAKALVVADDYDGPALPAAAKHDLVVLRLTTDASGSAGSFTLEAEGTTGDTADTARSEPDDIALILHTSGTTSRPKVVPLTQANISASAQNIGAALALTAGDRCLNVMPLFHIHGLVAAVSSSLARSSAPSSLVLKCSVICHNDML